MTSFTRGRCAHQARLEVLFYAALRHTQMLSISNQAHQSLSLHGGGSLPGLHTPTCLHWNEEWNLFATWSQDYVLFIRGTSWRVCLFLNCHTHTHTRILYFTMMCAFPIIACSEKRQTVCRLRVFLYGGYSRACVSVCAQDVSKWWVFEPHEADVAERSSHYTVPGFQPLFFLYVTVLWRNSCLRSSTLTNVPLLKKKKKEWTSKADMSWHTSGTKSQLSSLYEEEEEGLIMNNPYMQ